MFNLLPKAEKEAIRREYRLRLAVVTMWLSFVTVAVALVLLVPSYLLSSQKEKAAERRFELLSDNVKKQTAAEQNVMLLDAKSRLSLLALEAPKLYLHELLMRAVAEKGGQVSVHSLTVEGEGDRHILEIRGVAETRAALLAYVQALERKGFFEKVEVPPSNFAKNANLDFTLRAVIAPATL